MFPTSIAFDAINLIGHASISLRVVQLSCAIFKVFSFRVVFYIDLL